MCDRICRVKWAYAYHVSIIQWYAISADLPKTEAFSHEEFFYIAA